MWGLKPSLNTSAKKILIENKTFLTEYDEIGGPSAPLSQLSVVQVLPATFVSIFCAQVHLYGSYTVRVSLGLAVMSIIIDLLSSASYYDLLGVKPDASLEEIKNAFFDKSKKLHPDSNPANPSLHCEFVKLNEAYRVLSKDGTRKEYDLRLGHHYTENKGFRSSSYRPNHSAAETSDHTRYWEQFQHAQEYTEEDSQKKRKKNLRLVGYCIVAMLVSVGTHYVGFRKLEEMHNNFMDNKDKVITEIYNESKERARVNGFKKQQEILRQKHAEFLERYKMNKSDKEK